jgi:hypothetical protein
MVASMTTGSAPTGIEDPAEFVDLTAYPVLDLASGSGREVVGRGRAQLAAMGAAELAGFVTPAGVATLAADAESLAARAYQSSGIGSAYLDRPDDRLPPGHPRTWLGRYSVGAVPYDLVPRSSPLRRLYEWDPLKHLIEAVLDRGPIFRYADPFGALNLAVMGAGDELQWHFDQADFVVSLAVQSAETGGDFEVAPLVRSPDNERYDDVAEVLAGGPDRVVTLPMTPGTLLIFEGRHSLHRVSPIHGRRLRHVGLFAYDTKPDVVGTALLRKARYGRTEPYAEPPESWPA